MVVGLDRKGGRDRGNHHRPLSLRDEHRDLDIMEAAAEIIDEYGLRSCSVRSVLRELKLERRP